jgi:Beta-lactamase
VPSSATIQTAIPESAGLSTERLRRVHEAVQHHIDARDISGAVTVVERRGHLAHFEAHGLAEIESHRTMSRDNLFWIASMTKPVTRPGSGLEPIARAALSRVDSSPEAKAAITGLVVVSCLLFPSNREWRNSQCPVRFGGSIVSGTP